MCRTHTVLKILEFLAKIELSCRLYLKHSGIQNNSLKKVFQRNSDFEISGLEVSKKPGDVKTLKLSQYFVFN